MKNNDTGIVYVVGIPHTSGAISYYVEEQLQTLRLLSICPPSALRPFYQEGYLVGTFPHKTPSIHGSNLDLARRLIAKFRIPRSGFWSPEFPQYTREALYPSDDPIRRVCELVKELANETE
jgi:hypothetical protein